MKDSNLVQLGKNIHRYRSLCDLTQERLAEKASLHSTYVAGVERGERNISILNLMKIANALGVTLTDLVEGLG